RHFLDIRAQFRVMLTKRCDVSRRQVFNHAHPRSIAIHSHCVTFAILNNSPRFAIRQFATHVHSSFFSIYFWHRFPSSARSPPFDSFLHCFRFTKKH
ncbi:hypothetical protein PENTCL1PPCAC_3605, partial [Pristionchus entomophagus]